MRRRVCIDCHNRASCPTKAEEHWKGITHGKCSICHELKATILCARVKSLEQEVSNED